MIISSPGENAQGDPTFFQVMLHEIRAFIASFTHDYTGVLDITEGADRARADKKDGLKVDRPGTRPGAGPQADDRRYVHTRDWYPGQFGTGE